MKLTDLPNNSKIVEPGDHYNDTPIKNTDGKTLYFYYGVIQSRDARELTNFHGQIWESTQGDAKDFAVKVGNLNREELPNYRDGYIVFTEVFAVQLVDEGTLVLTKSSNT